MVLLQDHGVLNQPEFKSWFYVYKNNSVEESYKKVLKDNYLIDITEVDRYNSPDLNDSEDKNESADIKPANEMMANTKNRLVKLGV